MKKNILPFIISITAIIFSLLAIILVLGKVELAATDFFGWTTATLSVLVVILIGWQIYTFIDVAKKAQELQKLNHEFSLIIGKSTLNIEKAMGLSEEAISNLYYNMLGLRDPLGIEFRFLNHKIASLLHMSNFGDIETCDVIVKAMLEVVVQPKEIKILQSSKDNLLLLLSSVKHTEKIKDYSRLVETIAQLGIKPRDNELRK